jgi:hypothetical protein
MRKINHLFVLLTITSLLITNSLFNSFKVNANSNKESLSKEERIELDRAFDRFVNLLFREDRTVDLFETDFSFLPLSNEDMSSVDELDLYCSGEVAKIGDKRVLARLFATKWNSQFLPLLLAMGRSDHNLEVAKSKVEEERTKIIELLQTEPIIMEEFATSEPEIFEQNLQQQEELDLRILNFIRTSIDPATFEESLQKLQKEMRVKKIGSQKKPFYEIHFQSSSLEIHSVFAKIDNQLKIVNIGDNI